MMTFIIVLVTIYIVSIFGSRWAYFRWPQKGDDPTGDWIVWVAPFYNTLDFLSTLTRVFIKWMDPHGKTFNWFIRKHKGNE